MNLNLDHELSSIARALRQCKVQLRRTPADVLRGRSFTARTSRFLNEVGLPVEEVCGLGFNQVAEVAMVEWSGAAGLELKSQRFSCLGLMMNDTALVLDVEEQVLVLDLDDANGAYFVNSDIVRLGWCLAECFSHFRRTKDATDRGQIASSVAMVRRRIATVDPEVFEKENLYWALIIEQMESGMI